jgi:hypothetical protein
MLLHCGRTNYDVHREADHFAAERNARECPAPQLADGRQGDDQAAPPSSSERTMWPRPTSLWRSVSSGDALASIRLPG